VPSAQLVSIPMHFEPNAGQTDESVKFISRGSGYSLFLTATQTVLTLRGRSSDGSHERESEKKAGHLPTRESKLAQADLRMTLLRANPNAEVKGVDQLPGT